MPFVCVWETRALLLSLVVNGACGVPSKSTRAARLLDETSSYLEAEQAYASCWRKRDVCHQTTTDCRADSGRCWAFNRDCGFDEHWVWTRQGDCPTWVKTAPGP